MVRGPAAGRGSQFGDRWCLVGHSSGSLVFSQLTFSELAVLTFSGTLESPGGASEPPAAQADSEAS